MSQKPPIAIDFDGVLHQYSKGWADKTIYDVPVAGAARALTLLREKYYVIVFSCRAFSGPVGNEMAVGQPRQIEEYLRTHEIPFDEVWVKPYKPSAVCYVDDRAICFRGDWEQTLRDINNFRSWIDPTQSELHAEVNRLRAALEAVRARPGSAADIARETLTPSVVAASPGGNLSSLMRRLRKAG